MQFTEQISLTDLSREEKLKIWMGRAGVTYRKLAKHLGVGVSSTIALCRGETMPTRRHSQCVDFGIPAELLPEAKDLNPGPKPKN